MTQEKIQRINELTESHRQRDFLRQIKRSRIFAQGVYSKREEEFKKPAQQYRYGKR